MRKEIINYEEWNGTVSFRIKVIQDLTKFGNFHKEVLQQLMCRKVYSNALPENYSFYGYMRSNPPDYEYKWFDVPKIETESDEYV